MDLTGYNRCYHAEERDAGSIKERIIVVVTAGTTSAAQEPAEKQTVEIRDIMDQLGIHEDRWSIFQSTAVYKGES